ncbi:MAG: succinate dehydrogenase, hydrophobic membrane anchor protein [Acidiferrobacterales bacterium]
MIPRATGSVGSGLGEWLLQRVTALYIGAFALYLLFRLIAAPVSDYVAWKSWFAAGGIRISFALFVASLLIHSWIGMRSVFMDYVKPGWLRFAVSLLTATGLLLLAVWAADVLIQGGR